MNRQQATGNRQQATGDGPDPAIACCRLPVACCLFALLLSVPAPADAGRRRLGWSSDTDLLPQRGAELEWWLYERIEGDHTEAFLATYGVVGLLDTVELAFPIELSWDDEEGTALEGYGVEARWRLAPADPAKVGPVIPVVHAGVRRLVRRETARLDAGLVVSFDLGARLRVLVDVDAAVRTDSGDGFLIYGGGPSFAVTQDVFIGAELYGVMAFDDPDQAWLSAGPTVAVTHGRFWLTATFPVGLMARAPDFVPRLIWAMAF